MVALSLGTGVDTDACRPPGAVPVPGPSAPAAAGRLPDLTFPHNSGTWTVNASSDFTGTALRFSVTGAGVSIDPATGELRISTAGLGDGIEVVVSAENAAGAAASRFRLTVAAVIEAEAPGLVAAPVLPGEARIGAPVAVGPGTWSGDPAPVLGFQWRRDGADIAGATAETYVPGPADDLTALSCRVVATNSAGTAAAETPAVTVTWPSPVAAGALPDLTFTQGDGPREVDAAAAFTGGGLSFAVAGAGATVDPATGRLTIPADVPVAAAAVTVTARNSGGTAEAGFAVTVLKGQSAPALAGAPTLTGNGRIGSPIAVEPGSWSGDPVPALTFQWRRDGADIAGATAEVHVPGPADDLTALSCRVVATNPAGSAAAETAAVTVTWPAPVAAGELPDLALTQGSGPRVVEAAGVFAGGGLVFAAAGAGVSADPATGRVTVPTDTLVTAAPVTVSAANSGGAAVVGFKVSVAAAVLPPVTLGSITDVTYTLGSGPQTVSAQATFAGVGLAFALDAAPAGVTIDQGTGLITIPTDAALAGAVVSVRAANAAGAATQSFAVTVQVIATTFDIAGALSELGVLHTGPAPALTFEAGGFARLVPTATGRAHGVWARAGGDGLYRALVRWGAKNIAATGYVPFAFGARIRLSGVNFSGIYVEAYRPSGGFKRLRLLEYTGVGDTATLLQWTTPGWGWDTWYWVEMAIDGASVKARLYPEVAAAPAWQVEATTTATGPGAFGPTGFPFAGDSPAVDIRRLEYHPSAPTAPAAPQDGDWTLIQTTEQS